MLYASFAFLVNNNIVWFIMSYMWFGVFVIRMSMKDYSLSKKKGWDKYKEHSWLLFPKFFGNTVYALLTYAVLGLVGYKVYTLMK